MSTERVGENYRPVNERIKELRQRLGYESASQFARMHGFEGVTYRRIEQGFRQPHCDEIVRLRSALKCSYEDILG
jgi:transcriptional regulator with XRE-family HTH domain